MNILVNRKGRAYIMNKEAYERLMMDVTQFDAEDVITTSGIGPGGGGSDPSWYWNPYEDGFMPNGM